MIKLNKLRYFDVSFRYSRASWGVLGCPGVIKLTARVALYRKKKPNSTCYEYVGGANLDWSETSIIQKSMRGVSTINKQHGDR